MTFDLIGVDPVSVALVFVRVLGVMLLAPLFAHRAVPVRVRATVAMGMALLVGPSLPAAPAVEAGGLAGAVIAELVVGFAIGLVSALVFASLEFMGEVVSVQGGLGAAAALDPNSESASLVFSALMRVFGLIVFLAMGGHHLIIRALWHSFEALPVGAALENLSFGEIASLGSIVFETGLRLAAPLTIVLLVSNVVVGVLGRVIPQLNLMSLQLPAQIALTLLIVGLSAGVFLDGLAARFEADLELVFATVLGGR